MKLETSRPCKDKEVLTADRWFARPEKLTLLNVRNSKKVRICNGDICFMSMVAKEQNERKILNFES